MHIIQVGSTGVALILEEQIKYLLCNVVGIHRHFFFLCQETHQSISLVLDDSEHFASLVST